jgi:hypothetical protein
MSNPSPIVVGIALALYRYNVSPYERAKKLYDHFNGDCAELDELIWLVDQDLTAMALPSAKVYVDHAMETYVEEALMRVSVLPFDYDG